MKIKLIAGVLLAGVLAVGAATTNELSAALQLGLFEEEANHNLNAAIQAYKSVIGQYDKDRKLVATAIFRVGECYRKQNKMNEARGQYQRVVRDFSEQSILVEMSRKALQEPVATRSEGTPTASVDGATVIIVDNVDAEFLGNWQIAKGSGNKFGPDYKYSSVGSGRISIQGPVTTNHVEVLRQLQAAVIGAATATATFRPNIQIAGKYDVDVWFAQGDNRATNAPWLISSDGGEETFFVNQHANGGKWVRIASANFAAGRKGFVRLSNNALTPVGVGVVVVADAVRFRLLDNTNRNTASEDTTSGWVNLFNGQDLTGWIGDKDYWSVKDECLTAQAGDHASPDTSIDLISKGSFEDFELRLQYRFRQMAGNPNASAGIAYRSEAGPENGYHCNLTFSGENIGMLTSHSRPGVAVFTQRAVIRARSSQERIEGISQLEAYTKIAESLKKEDWNECVIIAEGNHLIHKINGHVVADVTDENEKKRSLSGFIALRLSTGRRPGVFVQFKNIQLKRLGSATSARPEVSGVDNEALRHLERMRIETLADVTQWQTLLKQLRSLSRPQLQAALPTAYPDGALSELLLDLAQAKSKLASLAPDLGKEHPEYAKADAVIKSYAEHIGERMDGILAGLEMRGASLKARLDELDKQIEQAKQTRDSHGSQENAVVAPATAESSAAR
ncbi:MAG: rane-bound dehydrogenase domain protein [Verrucomicrobiales bacterium]|nr:rane-bound dehydrogenase domain protein [Verrucomicrobiales bacterium]